MKLEKGMYVRTEKGIAKIIDRNDDVRYCYPNAYVTDTYLGINDDTEYVYEEDIIKASYNIIDLIEPMDLMYIDILPDDCGGIVVPRIAETLNELNDFKERFASGNCILKSVVTKEQIESMQYKVGD